MQKTVTRLLLSAVCFATLLPAGFAQRKSSQPASENTRTHSGASAQSRSVSAKGYAQVLTNGYVASPAMPATAAAHSVAVAPIRVAGVGASYGSQGYNLAISSGDVAGSISRISVATFNSMTPAQLRAAYDVLLFTWATDQAMNADWNTRIKPYLNAGGSVVWEDDSNINDLAPEVTGTYNSAYPYTVASVPGLTTAPGLPISNDLTYAHFRITSYSAALHPFITATGATIGVYGTYPGGGKMVITGTDQDYHSYRGENEYNFILNILKFVGTPTCTGPVVVTQPVSLTLDATGNATLTPAAVNNGSTAPCGLQSMTLSKTAFSCADLGANTVNLTVRDAQGNATTAPALVTVKDETAPTVLTQNLTVALDATGTASITPAQVDNGSSDNCGIRSRVLSKTSFSCAETGVNTVTLTVTDNSGNSSTGTATITVEDKIAPTVLTQNLKVQLDATGMATITAEGVNNGSSDNCSIVSLALDKASFDCMSIGQNMVTLTATDASGNASTGTAIITVEDKTAPTVLTQNLTLVLDAWGVATVTAAAVNNGSSDNCGISSVELSNTSFSCSNVGANTVVLTVTDNSGNSNTGTATITVEDKSAPTVVVQNISVTLAGGQASITAADVNNGSSDNCSIASLSLSKTSFTCDNIGANAVTLTATDSHGNVASAPAVVTVVGSIPTPTIKATPSSVYVGAQPTIYLGYGPQAATLTAFGGDSYSWSPATNLSSTTSDAPVFTPTAAGTYTYTLTATSKTGCSATTTITVTVVDARCGNKNDKVQICHGGKTLCVASSAIPAHLAHGDKLGSCATTAPATAAATGSLNELAVYPNPASEQALVSFRAALSGPAQVMVYNEMGQRVATLYNGTVNSGQRYSLTLDSQNLTAGLYECQLVVNGKTEMLRLVIAR